MSAPTQQSNQPGSNQIGNPPPALPAEHANGMVTPLNMPGAQAAINMPPQTVHANPQQQPPKADDKKPSEGEKVDVDELQTKYKGVQEIARQFEKAAVENTGKADAYDKLIQALTGSNGESAVTDPLVEIAKLRVDVETERTERTRSEIARLTGVPPQLITGNDAESMSASAKQALEWGQGLGQKQSGVPLVAPATTVNSDGKPGDGKPNQIQTRDELKNMSSKEIMAAYEEGRMDRLLGRPT